MSKMGILVNETTLPAPEIPRERGHKISREKNVDIMQNSAGINTRGNKRNDGGDEGINDEKSKGFCARYVTSEKRGEFAEFPAFSEMSAELGDQFASR